MVRRGNIFLILRNVTVHSCVSRCPALGYKIIILLNTHFENFKSPFLVSHAQKRDCLANVCKRNLYNGFDRFVPSLYTVSPKWFKNCKEEHLPKILNTISHEVFFKLSWWTTCNYRICHVRMEKCNRKSFFYLLCFLF